MASTEPYLYCSEIPFSQYVGQMFLYTIPTTCLTLIVHAVLACILYPVTICSVMADSWLYGADG